MYRKEFLLLFFFLWKTFHGINRFFFSMQLGMRRKTKNILIKWTHQTTMYKYIANFHPLRLISVVVALPNDVYRNA